MPIQFQVLDDKLHVNQTERLRMPEKEFQLVNPVPIVFVIPLIAKQMFWFWCAPLEIGNKDWHRQGDQFPLGIFQSIL